MGEFAKERMVEGCSWAAGFVGERVGETAG